MDTLKTFVTSRLAQLASRYIGGALIAWAGYTAAEANDLSAGIAKAVAAFIFIGADLLIHKLRDKVK